MIWAMDVGADAVNVRRLRRPERYGQGTFWTTG